MPIFEFRCKNCDHIFEELILGYESTTIRCPLCQSNNVEKLLSAAGIISKSRKGEYRPPTDDECTDLKCIHRH